MDKSAKFELPLVQASQSQKHVTVNEAVLRLEALSQLRIASDDLVLPPTAPEEGDVHVVPEGAGGDWSGQGGKLAVAANGGWDFVVPRVGWRGWHLLRGSDVVFDGIGWIAGAPAVSPNGAAMQFEVFEIDHVISAGPTSTTPAFIPDNTSVFAVTGRVLDDITGATAFDVGIAGISANRYGAGYGVFSGSYLCGVTGQPVTYYADTALTLAAVGGNFTGGAVRLAVHGVRFALPRGD